MRYFYEFRYSNNIYRGFIVNKIQEMMRSRSGLYRLLIVCKNKIIKGSAVHILGTFAGSIFIDRKLMLGV